MYQIFKIISVYKFKKDHQNQWFQNFGSIHHKKYSHDIMSFVKHVMVLLY